MLRFDTRKVHHIIRKLSFFHSLGPGILVKEEEKEVGAVAFHVYKSYWLAIGNCLATAILISMFLMQGNE